jgi:hypothetical protein
MAAKTAKKEEPQAAAPPASDGAKKERAPRVSTVRLLRSPKDGEKVGGLQVQGILKCLTENGKQMTTEELREELPKYITTRQDPLRVYMFYQKSLIDQGLISVASV